MPAAMTKPTKTWALTGSPLHELALVDMVYESMRTAPAAGARENPKLKG